ncbi:DUF3732 domain-containing protein [Exiguobacterium sp. s5]|uniref:DUF3732 domain-containing protein n=1 Tax=Exiguobacterium sp. s5 TaxID=2751239 RepID=UPI001BEC02E1|nr:DUF3732 domain-containing protein [Exiguobacterium sp. s5]
MKRWNIKSILLYSHDEKIRELEFELEKVNIITGDSRTGKSAIPEIIDYVMGASKCYIPSYVRSCLSWVGIVWIKDSTEFSIFRKIPNAGKKSSQDYYVETGKNINIPKRASELRKVTNLEGALKKFESILGIGDALTDSFGRSYEAKRITIRNSMPYLLQDDDVIISKNNLLRGGNEVEKKQSVIESIPYFFGVIDEATLEKEIEIKRVKKQIERIEKNLNVNKRLTDLEDSKMLDLIQEASQLGLCDNPTHYENEELEHQLNKILSWDLNQDAKLNEDQLPELYNLLVKEQAKIVEMKNKVRSAQEKIKVANEYDHTIRRQRRKLETINIFKHINDVHSCPLCDREIHNEIIAIDSINNLISKTHTDLNGVERERPKLDAYIREIKKSIALSETKINQYKNRISTLVKENEHFEIGLDIIQRRYKVIGRVSLYMETKEQISNNENLDKLNQLKRVHETLVNEVDVNGKIEALENVERRISSIASKIISDLPFEKRYEDNPIFINLRNLNVGVSLPTHSESMRDVGSDENYLSLHVSLLLAMHRHFANLQTPVPGVLLFDQLSRPYFPADKDQEEIETEVTDHDRNSLLQYFNQLFKEVDRGESLQVIVLEHAYFKNNDQYKQAVKYSWKKGETGLIPHNWPEK